jgi:hypothetical protein
MMSTAIALPLIETYIETSEYCEHCTVITVNSGDKYCLQCAQEVCDALYAEYSEQLLIDNGWY